MIAVEGARAAAWVDVAFLASAVPQAQRISVKWGDKRGQDLELKTVVVK